MRSHISCARAWTRSCGISSFAFAATASITDSRNSASARWPIASASRALDVLAQLVERLELGRLGGEVVVEVGQVLLAHLLDRERELRRLAGQVGGLMIVGEGDLDRALVAGRGAGQRGRRTPAAGPRRRARSRSRATRSPRTARRRSSPRSRSRPRRRPRPGARPASGCRSRLAGARPRHRSPRRAPRPPPCRPRAPCTRRARPSGGRRPRS